MADFRPSAKSFVYGLSDFWLTFFKEVDQLEQLYKGAEINAGQAYLDLMALLLNISLQDTVVFNKEFFKALTIDEDDVVFRLGVTSSQDRYRYTLPDNMVDGRYLNNKILAPTEALERDVDYFVNRSSLSFDFTFDPMNAYNQRVFGELNNAFRVRSRVRGSVGDLITVQLLDDGTTPVTVSRTDYAIVVAYDGPANGATGTAALIVQALNITKETRGLVVADLDGLGVGEGAPAGIAALPLLKVSVSPLDGYGVRRIEKAYGGSFTATDVSNWVLEGIQKGDILRVISGAGFGVPTELDIRLVRENALYVDAAVEITESDLSVDYAVLREVAEPDIVGEVFVVSGEVTQFDTDGAVTAATSTFTSPSISLSPVHTGELLQIIGSLNNGYATILEVTSPVTATIGGPPLIDEVALTWQLISILDPANIAADGVLTNNGDGTGTFTSAAATFTAAAEATVLRLYRGGALEVYEIIGYTDPNTITVALDASVANGVALDWGWARYRTPVNQLVFSPPVAWPEEGSIRVRARRAVDNQAVQEGTDYTVNVDTGRIYPLTVWRASVTTTVEYRYRLAVKENVTAVQADIDGTITPGSPNVFSAPFATFDASHVGYALQIANSGGNNNGVHLIASVLSPTSVTLTSDKFVSATPDPNNGSLTWTLLRRGRSTKGIVTAFVSQLAMWAPDALVDRFNLYNTYGYLINKFDNSSEAYRAFIRGIFQLFMLGPTLERFESAVNTVAGVPVARDDGEILLNYDSGASQSGSDGFYNFLGRTFTAASASFETADIGSFIYAVNGPNAGRLLQIATVVSPTQVILVDNVTTSGPGEWELTALGVQTITTSRTTYTFPRAIPMRETVTDPTNFGILTFRSFEVFTEVFTVTDYVEDPDWWEFVQIPEELMPYATAARRQSTPRLFENVVGPADDGRIGDPGFIVGADSEGFVPPSTLVRDDGGAADGELTPDPFFPSSSFNTYFVSPTAAFTSLDIGNAMRVNGVDYRITEIISATQVRIETFLPITAATGLTWEIYTSPLPKRNKAAFVILDKYLKYHLFTVSFDSSILNLLRSEFFTDLQDLVFTAKPTHTYIILSPAAFFEEILFITEELSIDKTLSLGGLNGLTVLGNENALLVVGSSWKIGSWFRYVSNSNNFAAPVASVPDALGVPTAGYSHYVTKFMPDHSLFTSGTKPVQGADLIFRDSLTDTGVAAEVVVGGNEATLLLDGTVRDDMLTGYITFSGSGVGNDGTYRIGSLDPPDNLVYVYAPGAGLVAETGLTWTLTMVGSTAGQVYLDSQGQSFFEDRAALRPFEVSDIGTYVRFPYPCSNQNTFRIQAMTGDPYIVRVAKVNQVDPVEPGTVPATLSGNTVTINNPGDILFDTQMASVDRGSLDRIFYVVISSGANTGERRQIMTWVGTSEVVVAGAAFTADPAADIHVEVEVHYASSTACADWEHVRQQVVIDDGDINLNDTPTQDAAVVTYDAEGIREPNNPAIEVFDDASGDTYYSVGMQDPKANGGRSRTSRDVDLRDEPIQITRA